MFDPTADGLPPTSILGNGESYALDLVFEKRTRSGAQAAQDGRLLRLCRITTVGLIGHGSFDLHVRFLFRYPLRQ